jgi:hypothetical protein
MICPNCKTHQSSDSCKLCGESLIARKAKVTEIPQKSKKKDDEDKIYNIRRPIFLEANPKCAVYPNLKSEEVHHKKGRVGTLYLDERFWLPVSKKAHREIEKNPTWAVENGYSELRLKTT